MVLLGLTFLGGVLSTIGILSLKRYFSFAAAISTVIGALLVYGCFFYMVITEYIIGQDFSCKMLFIIIGTLFLFFLAVFTVINAIIYSFDNC